MADLPSDEIPSSFEWDNLLNFSLNSPDHSFPWVDNSNEPLSPHPPLVLEEGGGSAAEAISRIRKRDPRLVCENFMAGRVPCSCPEMEQGMEGEEEEDLVEEQAGKKKKKARVPFARCQVPSCHADITHLKGYHRRHRVCLACANSPIVLLNDVPQRYCQQCGKFHLLPDFDEGKRSCRRKLERHNNRRRRKTGNSNQEQPVSPDCEQPATLENTQNETIYEQESKTVSSLGTAEKQASSGSANLQDDTLSINDRRSIAIDNNTVYFRTVSVNALPEHEGKPHAESEMGGVNGQNTHNDEDAEEIPSRKLVETVAGYNVSTGVQCNEHLNHGNLTVSQKEAFPHMKLRAEREEEITPPSSSLSSSRNDKQFSYVTMCPTRRISFKLYDWNPAEFPRRLRQQILHWLDSMPIELESYIRPGCTILTTFVSLPQQSCTKLDRDAFGYMHALLNMSGNILSDKGKMVIYINDLVLKSQNGRNLLLETSMRQFPKLYSVYPLFIEAGHPVEFIVRGKNLMHSKFRFLISFDGNYLHYGMCNASSLDEKDSHLGKSENVFARSSFEHVKVSTPAIDPQLVGPAFVEVENELGISNFVPILIGDKQICSELKILEKHVMSSNLCCKEKSQIATASCTSRFCEDEAKKQCLSELILDIAWVLKSPDLDDGQISLSDAQITRLNCLFDYLLSIQLLVILEKILFSSKVIELLWFIYNDSHYVESAKSKMLQSYAERTWESLQKISAHNHQKDFQWFIENVLNKRPSLLKKGEGVDEEIELLPNHHETVENSTKVKIQTKVRVCCTETSQPQESEESTLQIPLLRTENSVTRSLKFCQLWRWSKPENNNGYIDNKKRNLTNSLRLNHRFIIITVSAVTICAGICAVLQHPHKMMQISMSIRRCLSLPPKT